MKKLFVLLLSSVCIGIGINLFLLPHQLINGGVFGISLLINYIWDLRIGHMLIALNVPIYLLSLFFDKTYFINAIIGLAFTSSIIDWLAPLNGLLHLPVMIHAILGGFIIGIGVGLMLRLHTSPGGADLLALLISKSTGMNPGIVIFILDALIIVTGILVLKDITLLYSFITISCIGLCVGLLNSFKTIHLWILD